MKKMLFILLLGFSVQPSIHVAAQAARPEAVAMQAVLFVREALLADAIGSDATVVAAYEVLTDNYSMGPPHSRGILEMMRLAVDRIAPFESVLVCSLERPGRNKCELRADALLHVGVPSVVGDSATVLVNVWTASPIAGVQLTGSEITLAKRSGGWEVVGRKPTLRS